MVGRRRVVRQLLAVSAENTDALVRAAHQDDSDAVVELIKRCERSIAAGLAAAGLRSSDPLFLDAQNQALFTIWQQFSRFRGESEPCSWMYRVARRTAASRTIDPEMRERRRQERHRAMTTLDELEVRASDDHIVGHDLLAEVLRRLSSEDREILVLRLVQELSTSQTAELLYLSEGGVKARLHRAKKAALAIVRQLEATR